MANTYTSAYTGAQIESALSSIIANQVPLLDSGGKIPSSYLPSYVDDVIEGYCLT